MKTKFMKKIYLFTGFLLCFPLLSGCGGNDKSGSKDGTTVVCNHTNNGVSAIVKDNGYEATCLEDGLTDGEHCSICNEVITAQEIILATGHTASNWIIDKEATYTTEGEMHKECIVCGDVLETKSIPVKTIEAHKITFTESNLFKIGVYESKDYTKDYEVTNITYSRNGDTGEYDNSGDSQVNFVVIPSKDIIINDIIIEGTYKNLKDQEDNIYRVTKIETDLIITIDAVEVPEDGMVDVTFFVSNKKVKSETIEFGGKVTAPETPANSRGVTFVGWKNAKTGEYVDFENDIFQKDTEIYADFSYEALDLPIISIHTNDGSNIESKEIYTDSTISLENADEDYMFENVKAGVRGRGNSTWSMPKKSYRIKFDKKRSMLGSSYKAKSWTLLANYADKSLSRNYFGYELAEIMDEIEFSSMHEFVEVFLNDDYQGVYLLCDQIQTGEGRVEIDESLDDLADFGFFLENDSRAPQEGVENLDYIVATGSSVPYYNIKTPDVESDEFLENQEIYASFIKDFMNNAWNAIVEKSWEEICEIIDVDSFAVTYLIQELMENPDGDQRSNYMFRDKGGKLISGPIWDLDLSCGNTWMALGNFMNSKPDAGLYFETINTWYSNLLAHDEFRALVAEKLAKYKQIVSEILDDMFVNDNQDSIYSKYGRSLERNFEEWPMSGYYGLSTFENFFMTTAKQQLSFVGEWLHERYDYLSSQFKN